MSDQPLKMLSSMATRELLKELAAEYAQATGQSVVAEAAGGVDVAKRMAAGEVADVVVLAANAIDRLVADGKCLPGSRTDLVRSGIAIGLPAGTPRPDLSSESAVRAAVLDAPSLSYSTGPSGVYLETLFRRWGIMEQVQPRIVVPPPGTPVAALLAEGRVRLGFQQASEMMNVPGVEVAGVLPPEIQQLTVFSAGIPASCTRPDLARALLGFLAAPSATATKQRHGMDAA
jgi:molybdate transport system substrate-binding protein